MGSGDTIISVGSDEMSRQSDNRPSHFIEMSLRHIIFDETIDPELF